MLAELSPLWQVLGRFHPLVLHLPIGLMLGLVVLEFLCSAGKASRGAVGTLAWLTALSAVITAASGWVLSHEDAYGGELLERHERLGIAVAVVAVIAALVHPRSGSGKRVRLFRAALLLACGLLLPAGHAGATLTHGADWLMGPLELRPPSLEASASVSPDPGSTR